MTVYLVRQGGGETRSKAAGASVVLGIGGPSAATVGTPFTANVNVDNSTDTYPISATAVTVNWSPATALRLDNVSASDYFLQPGDTTPTEMLKFGISCMQNTDCRPEISDPSNISTAIQCVSGFCQNVSVNPKVPVLGVAGTHTFYLGARCPSAVPPPKGCLVNQGSGILATLRFTPLAGGPVTISLDGGADKTQVAATTQTTNLVSAASFTTPLNLTVSGGTGTTLGFKVKFDGITTQKAKPTAVNYTIRSGTTTISTGTASITADANAVYSGTMTGLTACTGCDVYIKESSHLQKKFGPVTLVSGSNGPLDWTGQILLGGDARDDNYVDAYDFVMLATDYRIDPNQATSRADFNYDAKVDGYDFTILAKNYRVMGD